MGDREINNSELCFQPNFALFLLPLSLALMHSEWPKLNRVLAVLNAIWLRPIWSFVKEQGLWERVWGSGILNIITMSPKEKN